MNNLIVPEIRPGTLDDIEAMALVTERTNADRAGLPLPTAIPAPSEDYQDLLENNRYPGYWSHAALVDDRLAGFVAGYPGILRGEDAGADSEYLWLLMIDPDYQRRGLGRTLLRLAAGKAEENGADSIFLHVVAGNQPACRLYISEGYRSVGELFSERLGRLIKYRLNLQKSPTS